MSAIVITTAGHIDHGKTSLLKALTTMDADRLPEEQRRGMTLDVGYAFMTLPDGCEVDFVDVPGHQDLLNNTIVGAAEADGFMLVVDAGEGIRAQTVEHMDVLRALGLRHGVAVLTKTDSVDAGQLQQAITRLSAGLEQVFEVRPEIVAVSSVTGEGIRDLFTALADISNQILIDRSAPASRLTGPALLPIDRVFVVRGRGTVLTGTLRGGRVSEGQTVEVAPAGIVAQVTEIQRRGQKLASVSGSGRVAVRLRGVKREQLRRGMVVAPPGVVWKSRHALVVLPAGAGELREAERIVLHAATDRVDGAVARVFLVGGGQLARLRFGRPVALTLTSQLLLRRSAVRSVFYTTDLIDTMPGIRWRKLTDVSAARYSRSAVAGPGGNLNALLALRGALADVELHAQVQLSNVDAGIVTKNAIAAGPIWLSTGFAHELFDLLLVSLQRRQAGLATADARHLLTARIRSGAGISKHAAWTAAQSILDQGVDQGLVTRHGNWLFATSATAPSRDRDRSIEQLLALLRAPDPPALSAALELAGCSALSLSVLERQGIIVRIAKEIAYASDTYESLALTACRLAQRQPVTPGLLRDEIGATRKYAVALLEYLNRQGVLLRTPSGHVATGARFQTPR